MSNLISKPRKLTNYTIQDSLSFLKDPVIVGILFFSFGDFDSVDDLEAEKCAGVQQGSQVMTIEYKQNIQNNRSLEPPRNNEARP